MVPGSLGARQLASQIAYIGGPPKTRQFFRSHPPADSQRIRWWDAGKMAIGLCHVPLAESAQTASGWASGHGRHAGGFRSRQAGSDGQPALHQRISFEPDSHKRDPPVRRPFITLAVWTIRCFFALFLILTYILIPQARWVSVAGVVVGVPGTLRRQVADDDVTIENTKILLSHDISVMIFLQNYRKIVVSGLVTMIWEAKSEHTL